MVPKPITPETLWTGCEKAVNLTFGCITSI